MTFSLDDSSSAIPFDPLNNDIGDTGPLPSPVRAIAKTRPTIAKKGPKKGKDSSNTEDTQGVVQPLTLVTTQDNPLEFVHDIEKLQEAGINVADLKKLREAGLNTALSVIYTTNKDMCNIKGFTEQKVDKLKEAARKFTDDGFMRASDFVKKISNRFKITTGSNSVDTLLGGGIESSSVTEIFGEFRCGKTQICHALAVLAQMPYSYGGANGKVCYIDTENTFRPDRIKQIAAAYGVDSERVLDNILYARCYNSEQLLRLLNTATTKMSTEKYALLIVDSIIGTFRVDFCGRGELADRQQLLGKVLSRIQRISEEFNLATVITNQVMSDPSGGMTFAANLPKPVGGHVLAHFSTTRLSLRKGRAEQRIMKIFDSPSLPEGDCIYEICNKGIGDVDE